MLSSYLPILILLLVAGVVAGALVYLARAVGPSRLTPEKALPYESGMDPETSPKIRFSVQFYRIALLFLVFDIEAAFFYPWAVLFRDLSCKSPLVNGQCLTRGTTALGIMVMAVFLAILLLGLVYVWRKKALEWE